MKMQCKFDSGEMVIDDKNDFVVQLHCKKCGAICLEKVLEEKWFSPEELIDNPEQLKEDLRSIL